MFARLFFIAAAQAPMTPFSKMPQAKTPLARRSLAGPLSVFIALTLTPALAFASDMCDLAHVYLVPAFVGVLLVVAGGYVARARWNFSLLLWLGWAPAAPIIAFDLYLALASHGAFELAHPSFLPAAAIKLALLLSIELLYRRFGER